MKCSEIRVKLENIMTMTTFLDLLVKRNDKCLFFTVRREILLQPVNKTCSQTFRSVADQVEKVLTKVCDPARADPGTAAFTAGRQTVNVEVA